MSSLPIHSNPPLGYSNPTTLSKKHTNQKVKKKTKIISPHISTDIKATSYFQKTILSIRPTRSPKQRIITLSTYPLSLPSSFTFDIPFYTHSHFSFSYIKSNYAILSPSSLQFCYILEINNITISQTTIPPE